MDSEQMEMLKKFNEFRENQTDDDRITGMSSYDSFVIDKNRI